MDLRIVMISMECKTVDLVMTAWVMVLVWVLLVIGGNGSGGCLAGMLHV